MTHEASSMSIGRLEVSVFLCGAAVMILEITGSRIIAPYLGVSIYSWASLIAVVLGSLSLGYWYGGRIADKNPSERQYFQVMLLCGVSILSIPLVAPLAFLVSTPFGFKYGPLVASSILFVIPSVLFGMVSPYAVRLKTKRVGEVGSTAGSLYAISTIGSITGTLLAGFILIPSLSIKVILIATATAVSLLAVYYLRDYRLSLVFTPIMVIGLIYAPPVFAILGTPVFEHDTPYYHIRVMDVNNTRTLFLDVDPHSAIDLHTLESPFKYIQSFILSLAFVESPENVLLLGMGGGTIGRYFLDNTNSTVDIVEIDPEVVSVAEEYFNFTEIPGRVRVYTQDARVFLNKPLEENRYDIIFVDLYPSHHSLPYHTATLESVEGIESLLKPGGVVAVNVISAVEGDYSSVFKAIYITYRQVFPRVYVFPMSPDRLQGIQNIVFFACNEDVEINETRLQELQRDLFQDGEAPREYTKEIEPGILLTDDYTPIESLVAASIK